MYLYSIMSLDTDHVDEICNDICEQYEKGVATCALFCMTLVPEGTPVVDKAADLAEKYDIFRRKLSAMGLPSGILVQATIGHGYTLAAPSPFRKVVNLNNGAVQTTCCPEDDSFCEYVRQVMVTLASCNPDIIMVDDDFRLLYREGNGCACDTHMAMFNKRAGTAMTREELFSHLQKDSLGEYARIFLDTQKSSLLKAARAMREGIDSVNPNLPGAFCAVGPNVEFAADIAGILAGEGNPIIVRINNSCYTFPGARFFSRNCYRAAVQIQALQGKADVILAETDTCPQNRYSTGAQLLHAHFTGTILEGAAGAKHWITRLRGYEPESGTAYRRILSKNCGFYNTLSALVPETEWLGCRIPLAPCRPFTFTAEGWTPAEDGGDGWSTHVLERFGLPLYYSAKPGGVVFLAGKADEKFTDDQILEFLHGPVFLAAESAEALIRRGFGRYLGVDVQPWNNLPPSREILYVNGNPANAPTGIRELTPLSDAVEIHSMIVNLVGTKETPLAPGVISYKNELGGTCIVYAGTPITPFTYTEAFSLLTYSRKQQFIRLLTDCGQLPVYYAGDEEVYLRAGRLSDGTLMCCVFNIGLDPIEQISLGLEKEITSASFLTPCGERKSCSFHTENVKTIFDVPAYTLNPVILFLR